MVIVNNKVYKAIDFHIDTENIEYKVYLNDAGKYCFRSRDLDAEENIAIYICKSYEQAKEYFDSFVNPSLKSCMI